MPGLVILLKHTALVMTKKEKSMQLLKKRIFKKLNIFFFSFLLKFNYLWVFEFEFFFIKYLPEKGKKAAMPT